MFFLPSTIIRLSVVFCLHNRIKTRPRLRSTPHTQPCLVRHSSSTCRTVRCSSSPASLVRACVDRFIIRHENDIENENGVFVSLRFVQRAKRMCDMYERPITTTNISQRNSTPTRSNIHRKSYTLSKIMLDNTNGSFWLTTYDVLNWG